MISYPHFKDLKRKASAMAQRNRGLSGAAARDEIARRHGYTNWAQLVRVVQSPIREEQRA